MVRFLTIHPSWPRCNGALSASLEDSTKTEDVVIEEYISDEADEEYTPRKDDGLEWWKKGKGSSARQAKKKQKRKVSKPANKKQGNISQYFLPENWCV